MTLNVGDVRYFKIIPVTICELEELDGEVKFAKSNGLRIQIFVEKDILLTY